MQGDSNPLAVLSIFKGISVNGCEFLLCVVGGNANNGGNCGFYGNWNVNAGNANWNYVACPNLSFVFANGSVCPHLLVKISPQGDGLVAFVEHPLGREILQGDRTMKRIGHLWEQVISLNNCVYADMRIGRNKPKNRMAKHIRENAQEYGKKLQKMLVEGTWKPHPNRVKFIYDRVSGKHRKLEIANLLDQAVELAWLNVAEDILMKRLSYYCCGSVPNAGQHRAIKYCQKCANKYKYGALTDVRHFYETIPHKLVMDNLRRIFKDEKFLALAQLILDYMGDGEVGIPIGHPISHWFANLSLMQVMHSLEHMDVKAIQYMDDIALFSNNKRHLRKAVMWMKCEYDAIGLLLKGNCQWFPISSRPIQFLSYRFSKGYCILKKKLMYRIGRKARQFIVGINLKLAQGMMAYYGIMKWCKCYRFRMRYVVPFVMKIRLRRYISNESKNTLRQPA